MIDPTNTHETRLPAPAKLTAALAGLGFKVELLVSRSGEFPSDPNAALDIDEPLDAKDESDIQAHIAAIDAWDAERTDGAQPTQRGIRSPAPLAGSASPAHEDRRDTAAVMLGEATTALKTLEANVLNAHWRIRGANFIEVHKFLGKYVKALRNYADQTAERCAAAGGHAPAIPAGQEMPTDITQACQQLLQMTTMTIHKIGALRVQANAAQMLDTFDLLTQVVRGLEERYGWWLASTVEGAPVADDGDDAAPAQPTPGDDEQ